MPNPPKLPDQVREKLRVKHYAIRTGQTYVDWIRREISLYDKLHRKNQCAADFAAFLTRLAVAGNAIGSASRSFLVGRRSLGAMAGTLPGFGLRPSAAFGVFAA